MSLVREKIRFLLKFRVILIVLTLLNQNMTTKMALSSNNIKGEGIELKKYACNKK